jgi:hypothetical protein
MAEVEKETLEWMRKTFGSQWVNVTPEDIEMWGRNLSWSQVGRYQYGDEKELFELSSVALEGDYVSLVYASNLKGLQRDYPDTFFTIGYTGSDALAILAEDVTEDLAEVLHMLAEEYPLYDESLHSEMEYDECYRMWDCYLGYDVRRDLENAYGVSEAILDATDDETLKEAYYRLTGDASEYPYDECGSIVFPCHDEVMGKLAAELIPGPVVATV